MIRIPGTCSSCSAYVEGLCRQPTSSFNGQRMFSVACVPCGNYQGRNTMGDTMARSAADGKAAQ